MEIKPLEKTDIPDILETFNLAYADYLIPLELTENQLRRKMIAENIDLSYSAGAFEEDRLVGFVLHAVDTLDDKRVLYNAATGVIPDYRGKGLVRQFYDRLMPRLRKEQFDHCLLEVITNNLPALRAYEKNGYRKQRELECFRGNAPVMDPNRHKDIRIYPLREKNYNWFPRFWNYQPTWQHTTETIRRSANLTTGIGLFKKGWMVAYGVIDAQTGRIKQFGVDPKYRRQGYGLLLFHHLGQLDNPELTVLNVDRSDEATTEFLRAMGFSTMLYQYEMKMEVDGGPR